MNSNYYYFSLLFTSYRIVEKAKKRGDMTLPLVKVEGVIPFVRFLPFACVLVCQFVSFRVYLIYDGNNDIFCNVRHVH